MLPARFGPSSCRSFCYQTVREPGTGSHGCARKQSPLYTSGFRKVRCERGQRTGATGQKRKFNRLEPVSGERCSESFTFQCQSGRNRQHHLGALVFPRSLSAYELASANPARFK
jgi:hypothetical protein